MSPMKCQSELLGTLLLRYVVGLRPIFVRYIGLLLIVQLPQNEHIVMSPIVLITAGLAL